MIAETAKTKRNRLKRKAFTVIIYPLSLFLISNMSPVRAEVEIIPSITLSETYDDNLFLDNENKVSDYITAVSPGVNLRYLSENSRLDLRYSPSFVLYANEDQNNTIRHSAGLGFSQQLTGNLSLQITDTYLRTEEPIEETEGIEGIRNTRRSYQRNNGRLNLQSRFGPENILNLGYSNSLLINQDPALNDGMIHRPYADYTHWFNVRNGIRMNFIYEQAEFSRDDGLPPTDDYNGFSAGLDYMRRFKPQTTGLIGYDYTVRNFDGLTEDYQVHNASLGLNHSFSPILNLSARAGFFVQENERSPRNYGPSYDVSLNRIFESGSFQIGGRGGWYEYYLDAEQRGFTLFNSVYSGINYQLAEKVLSYIRVSYRQDDNFADRVWKTFRGDLGLRWDFHRYINLSLNYSYIQRDDDVVTFDYERNQIMLILSSSRLFRL